MAGIARVNLVYRTPGELFGRGAGIGRLALSSLRACPVEIYYVDRNASWHN